MRWLSYLMVPACLACCLPAIGQVLLVTEEEARASAAAALPERAGNEAELVPRAAPSEPFGRGQPEAARSADHDMCCFRIDGERAGRPNHVRGTARRRDDDLADMACPLHQPEPP